MPTHNHTVRLSMTALHRFDALIQPMNEEADKVECGPIKVTRATVIREAMARGLRLLESEYGKEGSA